MSADKIPTQSVGTRASLIHIIALSIVIWAVFVLTEIGIMVLAIGTAPNRAYIPVIEYWPYYQSLFQEEPWYAIHHLTLKKALLIIEQKNFKHHIQIWGLYFYPLTVATHILVSLIAGTFLAMARTRKKLLSKYIVFVFIGASLLVFSVSYIRLASCCTGGDGWTAYVWLLSKIYSPFNSSEWYGEIHTLIKDRVIFIQCAIAMIGGIFMFMGIMGANQKGEWRRASGIVHFFRPHKAKTPAVSGCAGRVVFIFREKHPGNNINRDGAH
ncbi:MAG: hypothetical protein GY862_24480 [Gammaproteobacteria bacterium]|nr:hypothetical protein [Gammaproteobacteria bacterium]